jgi:hypothetical protein
MYDLDADTNQASWLTTNDSLLGRGRSGQIDEWTVQFLGNDPEETEVAPWIGFLTDQGLPGYHADAPVVDMPPPVVEVLSSSPAGEGRSVRLHISSARGALNATISIKARVEAASLDGQRIEVERLTNRDEELKVIYNAFPEEGIDLELTLGNREAFEVEVRDSSNGLPEIPGFDVRPRPPDMIPAVYDLTDTTNVTRTYTIEQAAVQ